MPWQDTMNKSEWANEVELLNEQRKAVPWEMARLMLWGIEQFCQTRDDIASLYDEMSEQLEISRKTLQNYASVARRFPPEAVHDRLEIGHHIVVSAMAAEVAEYWLGQAEAGGWSVLRLRTEIRKAAQTPDEDEDDEDTGDMRSMVLSYLNQAGLNARGDDTTLTVGFPDGHFVVLTAPRLTWGFA